MCDGGMPPASLNHRTPTAGDTPAFDPASSLQHPAAMASQNRRRCSRWPTGGRPGDRNLARPARSDRRFPVLVMAHRSAAVLQRPIESTQYASAGYQAVLAQHGLVGSMSRRGDCWDNAVVESFFHSLKIERLYDRPYATRQDAHADLQDYIERFYNR